MKYYKISLGLKDVFIFLINVEVVDLKNNLYKIKPDILPLIFFKVEQIAKDKNESLPSFGKKDCVFLYNSEGEDFYLDVYYKTRLKDEDIVNSIVKQLLSNIPTVLKILSRELDIIQSIVDGLCKKFNLNK